VGDAYRSDEPDAEAEADDRDVELVAAPVQPFLPEADAAAGASFIARATAADNLRSGGWS